MLLLAVRPAVEPLTDCCNPSLSFDQQRALLLLLFFQRGTFSPQMNDSKKIKPGATEHVWNVHFVWLYPPRSCWCLQLFVSMRTVCDEITVSIRQRQVGLQRRLCFGLTWWEGSQDCWRESTVLLPTAQPEILLLFIHMRTKEQLYCLLWIINCRGPPSPHHTHIPK